MNYTSVWYSPTRSLLQDCKHIKVFVRKMLQIFVHLWVSKSHVMTGYQPILFVNTQLNLDDSLPTKSAPSAIFYITQIYLPFPALK